MSPEASKHLVGLNIRDGRVRAAAYRAALDVENQTSYSDPVSARPLPRELISIARSSVTVTLIADLDAGLGFAYETSVGVALVRASIEPVKLAMGRAGVKKLMKGKVVPRGSGAVSWNGDSDVAHFVKQSMRQHRSVLSIQQELQTQTTFESSSQSFGDTPYAFERIGWAGPEVCGMNPDLSANGTLASWGYTGAGQTVSIADTGLWTGHARYRQMLSVDNDAVGHQTCDLSVGSGSGQSGQCLDGSMGTRVHYVAFSCAANLWCASHATDHHAQAYDHGTHVVGLVLKSAPAAKISMLDLQSTNQHGASSIVPPPDMYDQLLGMPYNWHSARIFSFSWAASYQGEYTSMDKTMDHFSWDHADALIVVAAGNEGLDGAHSIGSPGSAKNVLSVGAVLATRAFFQDAAGDTAHFDTFWKGSSSTRLENPQVTGTSGTVFDQQRELANVARDGMAWSSRGPTADGRRKPDVSAVGSYAVSDHATGQSRFALGSSAEADTSNSMQGTSMAAPILAGAIAVIAQLLDRCTASVGCVLNASTLPNMAQNGGYASGTRDGQPSSSLLRAFVAAATQPVQAQAAYISYWSTSGYWVRRPYRATDSASVAQAIAGTGLGEVTIARALLPSVAHPLRQTFAYGESGARSFVPLSPSQAISSVGIDTTLASVIWSGDNADNSRCFRTLEAGAEVVASLAWRDYPSSPGCNPCLQSDLALAVHTHDQAAGGATHDVVNNIESIRVTLSEVGAILKVYVFASSVSHAISAQRYSLVVSGAITRELTREECAACGMGNELVPCVSAIGYGDSGCTFNSTAGHVCERYSTCYAVNADGETVTGTPSQSCQAGDTQCIGIMFPSIDQSSCGTIACTDASQRKITHGAGEHECLYGERHTCVNYTNPITMQSELVTSALCHTTKQNVHQHDEDRSLAEVTLQIISVTIAAVSLFGLIGCAMGKCTQ